MFPINWNTAVQYAGLVGIAESVQPKGSYGPNEINQIKTAGYTFLQTIYGDDLATDIDPHLGDIVTFGFLAVSDTKELVAAIRGTDSILEWLHDASYLMVPSPITGSHGYTEDGFTCVYRSLRTGQANGTPTAKDSIKGYLDTGVAGSVTICGHSLGGALATLLTLDVGLNTSCRTPVAYTFASPRAGEHLFADSVQRSDSFELPNRESSGPGAEITADLALAIRARQLAIRAYSPTQPDQVLHPLHASSDHLSIPDGPATRRYTIRTRFGLRVNRTRSHLAWRSNVGFRFWKRYVGLNWLGDCGAGVSPAP